jgi:hypothetical protein
MWKAKKMPQDHIRAKVIHLQNAARKPLHDSKMCSFPDPGPVGFDFSLLDDEAETSARLLSMISLSLILKGAPGAIFGPILDVLRPPRPPSQ